MKPMNRRELITKAAGVGSVSLVASAEAAADPAPRSVKANHEDGVVSSAAAESCGARELFAVVDESGKLVRGLHAVSAKLLDVGCYEVVFARDVRRGAYVATAGGHGYSGVPVAAVANVMGRATNPRAVFVYVADMTGQPLASGFHLVVICPEGFA
jgi:hypothetical protein